MLGRAYQGCITKVGARLALLTPRKVYHDVRISHRAAQRHGKSHTESPRDLCVARQLSTDDMQNYFCWIQGLEMSKNIFIVIHSF